MAADTDSSAVQALVHTLSQNIDSVETALNPLLSNPLSTTSSKLPLLDKAKLYVHTAYAIESLIFSNLRLSGVDTKSHPVFSELGRVRAYFEKIKSNEASGPSSRLDKGAANRFIKHALSGNEEYDRQREEAQRAQQAGAKRKIDELAERYGKQSRFEGVSKRMKDSEASTEKLLDTTDGTVSSVDTDDTSGKAAAKQNKKKQKHASHLKDSAVPADTQKSSSRHRKKHSHAPKDAHQAFQTLLGKGGNQ
ncbi:hypothetical protein ANO11243_050730 [Dothideomycetidae sp. 11243]|nr:hypothetical protein ANO11243_050730 [fungal sp. No.11243]